MKVKFFKIQSVLRNKFTLQIIVSLFLLVLCVYFIKNEHLEVQKITTTLRSANLWIVILGIFLTGIYVLLQSWMYVKSFRATDSRIPLPVAIRLFLKRNLISIFLPAGAFSSLAFFNKELRNRNINNTQIYFASYLYGLCGLLTVIVVAVPVLLYLLYTSRLSASEVVAFIFLILLVAGLIYSAVSIAKRGRIYHLLARISPDITILLDDIDATSFNRKQFFYTVLISLGVEIIGIAHVYVAMLALGLTPSVEVASIAYVVMVILLIASPFLRGLGAIELSMAFVFIQYGFSTMEAATITLLFRFFEFWLPLILGIFSFISKKEHIIYRILPAVIIFILGIINVISAITPSIPNRLNMLQELFPMGVIEISTQLVLLVGVVLCTVSYYLFLGSRNAWLLALFLTGISALGHLLKGVDYEEATFASLAFISLIVTQEYYILKPNVKYQRRNLMSILIAFTASLSYAVIGFYFLEKKHLGIDFSFMESVKAVLQMYFLFDKPDFMPGTHFGNLFLNSVYLSFASVLMYGVYVIMQPYTVSTPKQDEIISHADELLEKYGRSPLDYFKTYFDKQLYISENNSGFVSFKISGSYAVVLENPVCKDDEMLYKLIREFDLYCKRCGLISVYYRIPESSRIIYHNLKKRTLIIGQEAILDTDKFTLSGKDMKSVRNALNKIEASGYMLKTYEPPLKSGLTQKLQQVSDSWLRNNDMEEIGFSQGVFDPLLIKNHPVLTIENNEEQVLAFLNIVPDYAPNEGTYDLIRMSEAAPNGSIDFLLVNLFQYFRDKKIQYVNMGLAPMAGIERAENITERVLKFAYEKIRNFDHYRGLREYKDKFGPEWINKYIAYSNDLELVMLPAILKDVGKIKE